MKGKLASLFVILAAITALLAVSGCLFSQGHSDASPTPVAGTPEPVATATPTPEPGGYTMPDGYTLPNGTWAWAPGSGDADQNSSSPVPGTGETNQTASPTPQPIVSAQASGWGTGQDSYARGATAMGWVYITNTGNVPINAIDFTIDIKKTILFFPIEKSFDYSQTGLDIRPGQTQRVEFSQSIPSEYSGISTAGDYQFTVTAKLAGNQIGSFSKGLTIV